MIGITSVVGGWRGIDRLASQNDATGTSEFRNRGNWQLAIGTIKFRSWPVAIK